MLHENPHSMSLLRMFSILNPPFASFHTDPLNLPSQASRAGIAWFNNRIGESQAGIYIHRPVARRPSMIQDTQSHARALPPG